MKLRTAIMALVAAAGLAIAVPGTASAVGKSFIVKADRYQQAPVDIARKIERVHYRAKDVRQIRDPYERRYEIDRLQSRLKKLRKRTTKYRGKQVRRNLYHIERLLGHLRHVEKKNHKRIHRTRAAKQNDYRYDNRRTRRYDNDRVRQSYRNYRYDGDENTRVRVFDDRGRLVIIDQRPRHRRFNER